MPDSIAPLNPTIRMPFSSAGGRRTAEIQTWRQGGVSLPDWRRAYSYDASGRLERVSHAVVVDGRSSFFGDDQYRFDDNGNLRFETNTGVGSGGRMIGARSATSTYDDGDRLERRMAQALWPERSTRNVAVIVDEAGQTRYDGQAHYAWDALGRLQGVTRDRTPSRPSSFERDTFGRVTQIRDAAGVRDLVWDGLTLLEERDAETHEVIRAYAASGFTQHGARYYYLRDPLGSVVGLMNRSGDVVKTWVYDAWGFRALSWQAEGMEEVEPALGYAGYLQHEESGLCLMPARAYNPALRRWLSRDPIGLEGGSINLYEYSGGDPIQLADPSGLQFRCPNSSTRGSQFGVRSSFESFSTRHTMRLKLFVPCMEVHAKTSRRYTISE
ncbi:MAG: RHS repeat-associated core domain-containing protein [Polyangiales bacterium]